MEVNKKGGLPDQSNTQKRIVKKEADHRKDKFLYKVQEIKNHKSDGVGSPITYLAMKNEISYAIGTSSKVLKVIENCKDIYKNTVPIRNHRLIDIVYIDHRNCYLLNFQNNKIYRKDIDEHDPYPFMDVSSISRVGCSFRYSKLNKKLILVSNRLKRVSVLNLERRKVEYEVLKGNKEQNIFDFKLFGVRQNREVCLCRNGSIYLFLFNYPLKKLCSRSHHRIDCIEDRVEYGESIAICDKNRYVLVELRGLENFLKCSRMFVFEIVGNQLVFKTYLDKFKLNIRYKMAIECCGYFHAEIIWIGFSDGRKGLAQMYAYDVQAETMRELNNNRRRHGEFRPFKIHRFGYHLYYSGSKGKFKRIKIEI